MLRVGDEVLGSDARSGAGTEITEIQSIRQISSKGKFAPFTPVWNARGRRISGVLVRLAEFVAITDSVWDT
jgi:hypothetical protein